MINKNRIITTMNGVYKSTPDPWRLCIMTQLFMCSVILEVAILKPMIIVKLSTVDCIPKHF